MVMTKDVAGGSTDDGDSDGDGSGDGAGDDGGGGDGGGSDDGDGDCSEQPLASLSTLAEKVPPALAASRSHSGSDTGSYRRLLRRREDSKTL